MSPMSYVFVERLEKYQYFFGRKISAISGTRVISIHVHVTK